MTLTRSNSTFAPPPSTSMRVLPYPYIGFVKNNTDTQNMGRLGVWIPELCGDPLEEGSWILCTYCSPFAGATNANEQESYQDTASKTVSQKSYGWVGVPPDINCQVMVVFAGGDISRAYWTGCIYQQNMNHMVPGISADTTYSGQKDLDGRTVPTVVPVQEYNKASVTGTPTNVNRPIFQPLTTGLMREGLIADLERGISTSSMRREAPPLVSGWLSPRGNSVHIDDNAENEFIRLRTRSGAQVLIHETTGFVYINSKDGNSWFEISDAGIDGYTAKSISLRAQDDINLIAGRDIVLDASGNINLRAGKEINLNAGAAIQAKAKSNITISSGADINASAVGGWNRQSPSIKDNSGAVPPAVAPEGKSVSDTSQVQQAGTTSATTWTPGGTTVNSIAARVPTHEPWSGHPNSKVPPIPATEPAPYVGPGSATPPGGASGGRAAPDSCSFGSANTKPISTVAASAITTAASKTGVDEATLLAFSDRESAHNPDAVNASSKAAGLFQFLPSTWRYMVAKHGNEYNIPTTASMTDPAANALLGAAYIKDNQTILESKGIPVNPGNLYLMHYMGPGAAPSFLKQLQSNPDTSAASLFPSLANSPGNRSIFYNADGSAKTMRQVNDSLTSDINGKANAYASQKGLPAPCQRTSGTAGTPAGSGGGTVGAGSNKIDPKNPVQSAQALTGKYWFVGGSGANASREANQQQCVALVQSELLKLPVTSRWTRGAGNLTGNPPPAGTGIATFNAQGKYTNTYGKSHAAIYLAPATDGNGIIVLEQSNGHPAHLHTYKNGDMSNQESDARLYFVINYN